MKSVIERIESAVGKESIFDFPEGKRKGILVDRSWIKSESKSGDVEYINVIDILEFEGQKEKYMRVGYYRVFPTGRLVWGSQTTITEPMSEWKKILTVINQKI